MRERSIRGVVSAPAHTIPPAAVPIGQLVAIITARLPSHMRSGIGLAARHDRYEGHFHRLTLSSVYQPIIAPASGKTIGHEGFVRAGADQQLSPWSLFSLAAITADPNWLVALDRLCRTLHAANYFPHSDEGHRLFVSVQPGLVSAVAHGHGEVFASILNLLGVATDQIVIQLPGSLNDDPERLFSAAKSFIARGFGLAVNFTGGTSILLASALAVPVFVKIDPAALPAGASLAPLLADCRRRGLTVLVKRLGAGDALNEALAAGADYVQGYATGIPEALPRPGRALQVTRGT